MIYLTVCIGAVLILALMAPFFLGPGGLLQASASINSVETLLALKTALLKRYLIDEDAHKSGALSALQWERRKAYLTHRYIDAVRRMDFLLSVKRPEETA